LCGDEASFLNDMMDEMSETYCEGDEPKRELINGELNFFISTLNLSLSCSIK